jgi:hypothetical protein
MELEGSMIMKDTRVDTRIWAWGEWEAEARVLRPLHQPNPTFPANVWTPYWRERSTYKRCHNTDPYIFDGFYYTDCKQGRSRALEGLKHLGIGSIIVFGSLLYSEWTLDTVFVVKDFMDHDRHTYNIRLANLVPGSFWSLTLEPTYQLPGDRRQRRLYIGATYDDPIDGMFSFFPCAAAGEGVGFPRPPIVLPKQHFNSRLGQGAKGHRMDSAAPAPAELRGLWTALKDQVESRGLNLGIGARSPKVE